MASFLDIICRLSLIKKTHDVSETGVCLRHQVKKGTLTLLGPIDTASPYLLMTDRLQFPKRRVFFDQG
jgi:hypothetical protein